jgi:hypothetical protein
MMFNEVVSHNALKLDFIAKIVRLCVYQVAQMSQIHMLTIRTDTAWQCVLREHGQIHQQVNVFHSVQRVILH